MNQDKKYNRAIHAVLSLATLMTGFMLGWYLTNEYSEKQTQSSITDVSQTGGQSEERDAVRREHSLTLASRLFTKNILLKQNISPGQAGLDEIQTLNNQDALVDPLTNKPYIFNRDQSKMIVGEVFFKVSSSCDDKIQGSDGRGMIIDATPSSVAVAIKLESGKFSCETNL